MLDFYYPQDTRDELGSSVSETRSNLAMPRRDRHSNEVFGLEYHSFGSGISQKEVSVVG